MKQLAVELRNEIARSKELTTNTDISDVFLSAEFIISGLASLIGFIAELEQRYRQVVVKHMLEGSHARAEAIAKSGDEYKEWRKFKDLYDLAHEQVMLLKKFRDDLQREYQRTQ